MAQMVVRNLDDDVKAKLQQLAKQHGRSTEVRRLRIFGQRDKLKADRSKGA